MKTLLFFSLCCLFLIPDRIMAQGFALTPTNWNLPEGGEWADGNKYSFNAMGNNSTLTEADSGCQYWSTLDINGDALLDLVIVQEHINGKFRVPGLPNNPHWKVYLGTNNGFSSTVTNWPLPAGGNLAYGNNNSFNFINGADEAGPDAGCQLWETTDINGDAIPDLIILREYQSGKFKVYGMPTTPYWKVYLGTATGFSSTATNWTLPPGGQTAFGNFNGFYTFTSYDIAGANNGNQLWHTRDINGDGKLDIIISREYQNGAYSVPGMPNNAHWIVYYGTATGFSTTATNYLLPAGGYTANNISYSFNGLFGPGADPDAGSPDWETIDINGDHILDLVITGEFANNAFTVPGLASNPHWKVYVGNATGFSSTALNWILPTGGNTYNGISRGFNTTYSDYVTTDIADPGCQQWKAMDMNGDHRLDLVVYTEFANGKFNVQGLPTTPIWKVYLGTPTGFNTTPINWTLPAGGDLTGGNNNSFNTTSTYGYNFGFADPGCQFWETTDINGDGKVDLVITTEYTNGAFGVNGLPNNPYWKVFINNSSVAMGINESNETAISLYPNPAGNLLNVEVPFNAKQLSIYNGLGEVLTQTTAQQGTNTVYVSNLTNGIYFLRVESAGVNTVKRFVVAK